MLQLPARGRLPLPPGRQTSAGLPLISADKRTTFVPEFQKTALFFGIIY
jgi:hypothetical protein